MIDDYRILLVDDDEDILWINQLILSEAGFSVDISSDPVDALKKIKSEKYRILVLDYMMPTIKGDELAKRVIEYYKAIRSLTVGIIFLSGYSEFVDYLKKVGDRSNMVLLKPVSDEELIDAIRLKIDYLESLLDYISNSSVPKMRTL